MKKIFLMGELGEKFGRVHQFNIKSTGEALRALRANLPEFEQYMIKSSDRGVGYRVFLDESPVMEDEEILHPLGRKDEVTFVPAIYGSSGTAKIIAGVALIALAFVLDFTPAFGVTPYLYGIGFSLAAGGIIQLLSPIPRLTSPLGDSTPPSYFFTGPVNTSAQGNPVAILYGRMIVGSAVISAGIVVEELT